MSNVLRKFSPNIGAVEYFQKSLGKIDPAAMVFSSNKIDQIVSSKRRNHSILQGEWGREYHTTGTTVKAVELQREVGPSYERSITHRNITGVVVNPLFGGVTPVAAAGTEVELIVLQQHINVQMDEVHGRRRFTGGTGVTFNPTVDEYRSAAEVISEKLALVLDQLTSDQEYQSAVCITSGRVPSIMNKDHTIVDYKEMHGAQVGVYEIPKATKRTIGTVPILLAIRDYLEQAATRYNTAVRYMLVCNNEFLNELLLDEKLMNYYINQPMPKDVNPLYTGQFISHWASRIGGNIDIIRDDTQYYYPAKKSDGTIEMINGTALPRKAASGDTIETNRFKSAKPTARMIAVIPDQFTTVKGILHGNEGGNTYQRIKAQPTDFDTGVTIVVERVYLPYYACPHLSMDITIASGDDVTGVGKLKTAPTRYQAKS